jgi:hypothetical protein
VVLENDCHRNEWPLALVEKTIVENDGLVRKATVRVATGHTYDRPIDKLRLLIPVEERNDSETDSEIPAVI